MGTITGKMQHMNHPDKSKGFYEVKKDPLRVFHFAENTPYVRVKCADPKNAVRCNLAIGAKGKEANIAVSWALAKAIVCGGVELIDSAPRDLKNMIRQAEQDLERVLAKKQINRKL